jgi:mRNA-degrading endonuclease RelE of RelBE toxin-antitoxin system
MRREPYAFDFTKQADEHIELLEAGEKALVFDAIDRHLKHEPTTKARNRKPMNKDEEMYIAPWELRVRDLRVYYGVKESDRIVVIVAVGKKSRAQVQLGNRWIRS